MEPYTQHPVTGAARVRSDPSCAGQARGRARPNILIERSDPSCAGQAQGRARSNILIDVRPTLAGTPYMRQVTQAIENN